MDTVYLVCFVLGAVVFVAQFLATALGFGLEVDSEGMGEVHAPSFDGHGNSFFGVLSLRTLAAAIMFFGLGGKIAYYYDAVDWKAFAAATGAGAMAFYLVALSMRWMKELKADGTARIDRSVGCTGTVYLRIPAERQGAGKVHIVLQNRTVEYQALTPGKELPTGHPIRVVGVINADTVEVEAV